MFKLFVGIVVGGFMMYLWVTKPECFGSIKDQATQTGKTLIDRAEKALNPKE